MPQPLRDRGFPWGACKKSLEEGGQWDLSHNQVTAAQEHFVKGSARPGWAAGQGDLWRSGVCPTSSWSQEEASARMEERRLRGGDSGHKCSASPRVPPAACMHPPLQGNQVELLDPSGVDGSPASGDESNFSTAAAPFYNAQGFLCGHISTNMHYGPFFKYNNHLMGVK